jgi:hypothetical protein
MGARNADQPQTQLQILTAVVKLFLKKPSNTQGLVQKVLQAATAENDNPDIRDRAYVYWRLLSGDLDVAKVSAYNVIVAEHVGQIGVRRFEHDLDLVRIHLDHVLDRTHRAGRAGRGIAAMQVDGIDDVVGIQALAVAERDSPADIADPFLGIVARLQALQEFGLDLVLVVDLDQAVGTASSLATSPGLTAKLEVNYRRPTPLFNPLEITAEVERTERRKVYVNGRIRVNGEVTAEAKAIMVRVEAPE